MGNITQLKQGSLNGLRKQTNECLDNAYNKGFEDGKKWAIDENAKDHQGYYNKGLEDGYQGYKYINQWFCDNCFFEDEENLFPEYKRRQADTCCLEDIITDVGFAEVLNRIKAYEEKKKSEEESIQVGDVVKFNEKCHNYDHVKTREFLVLHIFDNGLATILYDNGDTGATEISLLDKTGRHFGEVEQLLNRLKGE